MLDKMGGSINILSKKDKLDFKSKANAQANNELPEKL